MSSLRLELEQSIYLKFPEVNRKPQIRFEESMEIPPAAEQLMRGMYHDPERVKGHFQELQQQVSELIELLLPWRSKIREWADRLPEKPLEAERYLRDYARQIGENEKLRRRREEQLLEQLQESARADALSLSCAMFGEYSLTDEAVKIFLKPIGKAAEVLQLNPELLRQGIRVYFFFLLLLIVGLDLDGETCRRAHQDPDLQRLADIYTLRYLHPQPDELRQSYEAWRTACGARDIPAEYLAPRRAEQLRAAMIFWRRQKNLPWDDLWRSGKPFSQREEEMNHWY
ncbi:MAG: hypothetical protein LBT32_05115 [Peptococcaceae bacterium]|jgi:hypothetical protein|nr:hypothetical protein [Peptococcaceae bacterium]